jgi:hypothetical protein
MSRQILAVVVLALPAILSWAVADAASSLIEVDYRSFVSRADLDYSGPASR